MRIVILRHGEATLSNCDRVLSSQGMKEAVATGQKLSKILTITKCFCSPKTRAEQTANIVCQQLGFDGNKETLSELTHLVILQRSYLISMRLVMMRILFFWYPIYH